MSRECRNTAKNKISPGAARVTAPIMLPKDIFMFWGYVFKFYLSFMVCIVWSAFNIAILFKALHKLCNC